MRLIVKITACCILALTQFSCTSLLFVNTTLPPAVKVDNEQWKVVTVNRFNPELLPYSREKKLDVFGEASNEAVFGAMDAIVQDRTFSLVANDSSVAYKAMAPKQGMSKEEAQEIYAKHPNHLILALENFDAFFNQTTEREKGEDGNVSKTAHYILHARTTWALYDSTGTLLDRTTLDASEYYKSRGVLSGLLAVGPSITNAGPSLNKLAWDTGIQYWQRLHPKPVSFTRSYYSNKEFQAAAAHMASNDWNRAKEILLPLAEGSDKKIAGKAAYNLAIISEAQGDMDSAKKWAKFSADKGNRMGKELMYAVNYNSNTYSYFQNLSSDK